MPRSLPGPPRLFPSKDVSEQIHDIDSKLETKRLIIIDNLQNFFLSHRKGFEAYRSFASLLTLRTKNIFWCVSINTYSWLYLNAVNNESQIFRKVFHVQAWDDEEIKDTTIINKFVNNNAVIATSVSEELKPKLKRG